MKRILFSLCAFLWSVAATAQVIAPNQTITVIDSGTACVTAPAACATWAPTTSNAVTIDISGTWTGTLTFEGSANGGVWNSILVTNLSTGGQATSTTANATFSVSNAGLVGVRVRATAFSSGTAQLTATRGYLNARSLSPIFPLSGSAVGDLLRVSETSPLTLAGLADVATGSVLASGGLNTAPAYTATPSLTTLTLSGGMLGSGNVQAGAGNFFYFLGREQINSPADGLWNVTNSGSSFGVQFNGGTAAPTVTACGTGAVTAHSSNSAGEVTATGATSCTVTFGAPNWTNQPFCVIEDETSAVAHRISAISITSFTVTSLTSGDKFMFHCSGGV